MNWCHKPLNNVLKFPLTIALPYSGGHTTRNLNACNVQIASALFVAQLKLFETTYNNPMTMKTRREASQTALIQTNKSYLPFLSFPQQ